MTSLPPKAVRGSRSSRFLLALGLLFLILGSGAAPAGADAYLRVIAQEAPVRTGPGAHYRHIYRATRGEVFPVLERGTRGYWFRVELEDGTTGWILGDLVFPFEVVDKDSPGLLTRVWRRTRRALFGPPPVPYSHAEISFSSGVLAREGVFLLRPGWLIDRHFAIEGFLGLSPRATNNLFLAGAGWTLRMAPSAAVGPYLNAAVGAAHLRPKADNFLDERKTLTALTAGGGFEVTLKKQIIVRLDFRNWTLFDSGEAMNAQEYSGGLAFFF